MEERSVNIWVGLTGRMQAKQSSLAVRPRLKNVRGAGLVTRLWQKYALGQAYGVCSESG